MKKPEVKKQKIFVSEFNPTSTTESKVAYRTERESLPYFLYHARHVGHEYNEKGYFIRRENGTTYLLCYTKSGHATVQYEGETIELEPGSLLFISLAKPSVISAPNSHWEIYFTHVFGPDIDVLYNRFYQNQGCYIKDFDEKRFVDSINYLYDLYNKPDVNLYLVSSAVYNILMDALSQSKPEKYDYVIVKAIDYIEQHYSKKLDVNELCKQLFVSTSHFIHKFHKQTGLSPKRYLTNVRINKAKMLLAQTTKSIAEIAQLSGFENEKNIYYAFKTLVGLSPTEFRANMY